MNSNLEYKLSHIPKLPGCYLWKDKYGKVIYVGKAKNLFNRTHQYFNSTKDNKTSLLVDNIDDVDFIVVKNENESLILENNLIKKYQPKFNILLKDGSSYPYIVVTNEKYPRIVYTRDLKRYKGKYYGPFASTKTNKFEIYNLLLRIFPLRKCNVLKKTKCLYYDIHECLGPCIKKIDQSEWISIKKDIDDFFKGNTKHIINVLQEQELELSKNLQYEEAQKKLDLINGIKQISESQNINLGSNKSIDVIGFYQQDNLLSIVIFSYTNGKLLTKNQQIAEINNQKINDVLSNYLMQYYYDSQVKPKVCYIDLPCNNLKALSNVLDIKFIKITKGKYKDILQDAVKNAKQFFKTSYLIYKHKKDLTKASFEELKKTLCLDNLSLIHVYDISNLFQDDQIGAMIALEDGEFNKNLFRKFIIKNPDATSDYSRMKEVIYRQYKRMLNSFQQLPNLIIMDGGIIQVNAAIESLKELNLDQIIPVIGLSKDKHHKTNAIVFPNKKTITLNQYSSLYMYLLNIQEEVHRYAISFFRNRNISSKFKSRLNEIEGLGEVGIKKLMENYESLAELKKASIEELCQFTSIKVARRIAESLKNKIN